MSAVVPSADGLASPLLHGGAHAAGTASTFDWWYVAASVALVGGVGGLLYWYYGERAERR